jgi:flagellar basal body-associated protein FliL
MKDMENSKEVTTNWAVIKDKLMQQFSTLTEEDLSTESGTEEEVFNKLEAKLGMPKEEIHAMINQI